MKIRTLLLGLAAMALLLPSGAAAADSDWNVVQAGIWFGFPASSHYGKVTGIKIGLPISSGVNWVDGVEASLFGSNTLEVNGVQMATIWNYSHRMTGVQLGLGNVVTKNCRALQLGIFNWSHYNGVQVGLINAGEAVPIQVGLLNFNPKGFLPFMVIFNMAPSMF